MSRILTDRGMEHRGATERHEYELYLAVKNINYTKSQYPQTNGTCERFHKTMLNSFYRVAFCKKINRTLEERQLHLDLWL